MNLSHTERTSDRTFRNQSDLPLMDKPTSRGCGESERESYIRAPSKQAMTIQISQSVSLAIVQIKFCTHYFPLCAFPSLLLFRTPLGHLSASSHSRRSNLDAREDEGSGEGGGREKTPPVQSTPTRPTLIQSSKNQSTQRESKISSFLISKTAYLHRPRTQTVSRFLKLQQ